MKDFLKSLIIFLVIAIPSCHGLVWLERQSFYEAVLPEKIEISRPIIISYHDCFFAVYKLSDKTLSSIKKEGITFFSDATKSRAYERNHNMYHTYRSWQITPVQDQDGNQSFWAGIRCVERVGFDESLRKKIELAAYAKGSFYTGHSEGQLVVIPNMGIAVLAGTGD